MTVFFLTKFIIPYPQSTGSIKFVPRPLVYMWGGGTTVPLVLPSPSDARVVGVACGRSQKVGVTEDGKLFMWQVRSDKTPATPHASLIFSSLLSCQPVLSLRPSGKRGGAKAPGR